MEQEKCILCGRESSAGLQVLGCAICFDCEKKLMSLCRQNKKTLRRLHRLSEKISLRANTDVSAM